PALEYTAGKLRAIPGDRKFAGKTLVGTLKFTNLREREIKAGTGQIGGTFSFKSKSGPVNIKYNFMEKVFPSEYKDFSKVQPKVGGKLD
ncbi:MAG: hypothetical protein ABIH83_05485, partial [Candidatus Micrarchaeota archaeon]